MGEGELGAGSAYEKGQGLAASSLSLYTSSSPLLLSGALGPDGIASSLEMGFMAYPLAPGLS